MSRWKLLAATPLLLIPLAFAGASVGDGIEHRESRPAFVLPSLAQGPQVTMRPATPDKAGPEKAGPGKAGPGQQEPDRQTSAPPRGQELSCTHDDDDDDDDRDDDEVEVVQPCPDAVGHDDDGDDGDDSDGDD